MKKLNQDQLTSLSAGKCDPEFLFVVICVLMITGNHLTDICHPLGNEVILNCD